LYRTHTPNFAFCVAAYAVVAGGVFICPVADFFLFFLFHEFREIKMGSITNKQVAIHCKDILRLIKTLRLIFVGG
jgi:hypothetical protein